MPPITKKAAKNSPNIGALRKSRYPADKAALISENPISPIIGGEDGAVVDKSVVSDMRPPCVSFLLFAFGGVLRQVAPASRCPVVFWIFAIPAPGMRMDFANGISAAFFWGEARRIPTFVNMCRRELFTPQITFLVRRQQRGTKLTLDIRATIQPAPTEPRKRSARNRPKQFLACWSYLTHCNASLLPYHWNWVYIFLIIQIIGTEKGYHRNIHLNCTNRRRWEDNRKWPP